MAANGGQDGFSIGHVRNSTDDNNVCDETEHLQAHSETVVSVSLDLDSFNLVGAQESDRVWLHFIGP